MRKYRIYGKDSIIKVIKNNQEFGYDTSNAIKALTDSGCTVLETTPYLYTTDEIKFITERYHKRYPGSFSENSE